MFLLPDRASFLHSIGESGAAPPAGTHRPPLPVPGRAEADKYSACRLLQSAATAHGSLFSAGPLLCTVTTSKPLRA